ncbi:MAG: hypothetical protein ACYSUZ_01820 [Planctomycetota bacterium]|jgi:hypothetical protein
MTRQLSQKRDVAFAGSHVICVVFLMLFLVLPALAAQADRSEDKPLPEASDADPNAIASTPDGDSDVTELLSEDKKITREDEAKGAESPLQVHRPPTRMPFRRPSTGGPMSQNSLQKTKRTSQRKRPMSRRACQIRIRFKRQIRTLRLFQT